MTQNPANLVWIDLEMTGLDPDTDRVIEIATIVTDAELNILAEGPVLAIHQPDSVLKAMDEWNSTHHNQSGLVRRVRDSAIKESDAEHLTLEFVKNYVPSGKSPMCGNSVCQDRRFLARSMPHLEQYFHYRNLDVSTVKELCLRWAPDIAGGFSKESAHRALQDIRDSINELAYYRGHFLKVQ